MNPNVKHSFLEYPKTVKDTKNIYLQTDLGIFDVLSEVPPAGTFTEIKNRAAEILLYGYNCKVIAIDDLIKIKESMTRAKDIQIAKELKAIKTKS
jgi:predicted nucleotidyltransferase